MSVRRTVEIDGDGLVVRERREAELADFFDAADRLVLQEDGDDWVGYRRVESDGEFRYYHHDDRRRDGHPFGVEMFVSDRAVRDHVRRLIEQGRLEPATSGGEYA